MIEEISYGGWKRNLLLRGPATELVITLDIGPRVIRYAFHDGDNVFVEMPGQIGGSGEKEWTIRGGHRFWTAPEADHSYEPDNTPVGWRQIGEDAVEITPAAGPFGFQKILRVELLPDEIVRVTHRLVNTGTEPLQVTPWALSVMAPGGVAVVPQPELDFHPTEFPQDRKIQPEDYLPNRELVLWPFTNLSDGRYRFSRHFLRFSYRDGLPATKIGLRLAPGWLAYQNRGVAFVKHIPLPVPGPYPDRNVNCELFTNPLILEVESLAPLGDLPPGGTRDHVEHWVLRRPKAGLEDENAAVEFFAALPSIA